MDLSQETLSRYVLRAVLSEIPCHEPCVRMVITSCAEWRDAFLETHKPVSDVPLGLPVFPLAVSPLDTSIQWYATGSHLGGRCMSVVGARNNKLLNPYKGQDIPTHNAFIDTSFVKIDRSVPIPFEAPLPPWTYRCLKKNGSVSVQRVSYLHPVGFKLQDDPFVFYSVNSPHTTRAFSEETRAKEWLATLRSIVPGDKIYVTEPGNLSNTIITVERAMWDSESVARIPDWLVPPTEKIPFVIVPKGKAIPKDYFATITRVAKGPRAVGVVTGSQVIFKHRHMVVFAPMFPVCFVEETYETGMMVTHLGTGARWFIHAGKQMVMGFPSIEEAEAFSASKRRSFEEACTSLFPGDLVLNACLSDHPFRQFSLPSYWVIVRVDFGQEDDPSFPVEVVPGPSTSLSRLRSLPRVRYWVSPKHFLYRHQIHDAITCPEPTRIEMQFALGGNLEIGRGDRIDLKAGGRNHKRVEVERIVPNGIVFNNGYFPVDKCDVLRQHIVKNTTKRQKTETLNNK